jgi:hypothetical protein
MDDRRSIVSTGKGFSDTLFAGDGVNELRRTSHREAATPRLPFSRIQKVTENQLKIQALKVGPDRAILRLARVLARQAAREDHARECADEARDHETSRDLRPLLDRSSG